MWDKDFDHIKDEDRPCFVIELDDLSDGYLTNSYIEQNITVILYYFASNRQKGYADLLKKKAELSNILLNPLTMSGGFVITTYGVDYTTDKQDMVLTAVFDVYTVQQRPEKEKEPMEELFIKEEL